MWTGGGACRGHAKCDVPRGTHTMLNTEDALERRPLGWRSGGLSFAYAPSALSLTQGCAERTWYLSKGVGCCLLTFLHQAILHSNVQMIFLKHESNCVTPTLEYDTLRLKITFGIKLQNNLWKPGHLLVWPLCSCLLLSPYASELLQCLETTHILYMTVLVPVPECSCALSSVLRALYALSHLRLTSTE